MKKKNTPRKRLSLNKESVRRLTADQSEHARGGVQWTGCLSDCTECPTVTKTMKPHPLPETFPYPTPILFAK